jgi:hypothetical protein
MSDPYDEVLANFEKFALDHNLHRHCASCRGCLLDTRQWVLRSAPLWCVACRDRIKAHTPKGHALPWEHGWEIR